MPVTGCRAADVQPADLVKVGFVYNFTKFVEWPAASLPPGSPLNLCVAGSGLGGRIDQLHGRLGQGHEIRVHSVSGHGDLAGCHVLFIANSEERRLNSLLNAVANSPVLTISDIESFPADGGMIGLTVRNSRVGFTVSLANTRATGLKISSQLLRLGEVLP